MNYETDVNSDMDLIDSRDVIQRIDELEAEQDELDAAGTPDEDLASELCKLRDFAEDGENSISDWQYGETLIRDTYFIEFARELANDIGADSGSGQWPFTCIDWEHAARELKQDYYPIEFDGVMYWGRA